MKSVKNSSRYNDRSAAKRVVRATLFASAIALMVHTWRSLKARPAKSLIVWIVGGLLAFADLLFPGVDLHLEPTVIIEFVARVATWLWRKFETLHIVQILLWMALALATTRGSSEPPEPPRVEDRPQRRRRRKPT